MHALFRELTTLLGREIEQYRRLLVLVRRERGRITRGELTGLLDVVRFKEQVAEEMESLERSRGSLLDRLAAALGEERSTLSLARLAQLAPADLRESFQALLAEFRGVVGRLMAANDINRRLLDRSLEVVQGSLALFRTVVSAGSTYGKTGAVEAPDSALVALNRLA